uniref:Ribosome biogenesis protein NOP53 n=1 Tax=Steinernema glaseri TaxID=37863 RepID=A0A1I8AW08_9BILA
MKKKADLLQSPRNIVAQKLQRRFQDEKKADLLQSPRNIVAQKLQRRVQFNRSSPGMVHIIIPPQADPSWELSYGRRKSIGKRRKLKSRQPV